MHPRAYSSKPLQGVEARTRSDIFPLVLLVLFAITARSVIAENPTTAARAEREALARFQKFVGEWRGVGQPKRGSAKDAWSEECRWVWSFQDNRATLAFASPNGKYVRSAQLRSASEGKYELTAQLAIGGTVQYSGGPDEQGSLILLAARATDEAPARLTIRLVAGGDRLLILYERRVENERFQRLAEVGSTRQGSGFGQGTNYVECVVTGGVGTIAVTHEGQTYYVCCTGCRDYFQDNPAEVLAEYRARKAAEQDSKRQKK